MKKGSYLIFFTPYTAIYIKNEQQTSFVNNFSLEKTYIISKNRYL